MPRAVGIDLGITDSMVAVVESDLAWGFASPTIVTDSDFNHSTPSVVTFTNAGDVLVGHAAKNRYPSIFDHTFVSIQRELGTSWRANIDGDAYCPHDVVAHILHKLKDDAENYMMDTVTDAVIAVPAYFNNAQRMETVKAGRLAGFRVVDVIDKPIAAALAHGLGRRDDNYTVFVLDLNNHELSASVLGVYGGALEIKSISGDNGLGGDNWTEAVVDWLIRESGTASAVDFDQDVFTKYQLLRAAKSAISELTRAYEITVLTNGWNDRRGEREWSYYTEISTTVDLSFAADAYEKSVQLSHKITLALLDELTNDLLDRCRTCIENALQSAGIDADQVDNVLFVGGSSGLPGVRRLAMELFEAEPFLGWRPEEVVLKGAGFRAGALEEMATIRVNAQDLIERMKVPIDNARMTAGIRNCEGFQDMIIRVTEALSHSDVNELRDIVLELNRRLERLSV